MLLNITVKPNSKTDEIVLMEGGGIKVKIKAPPVEGKANVYLVKFLAKKLGIAKSAVLIVKGHTSSHKRLEIAMEEKEVRQKLGIE